MLVLLSDEQVDEDVEVVAEAAMSESSDAADDEDVQELGRVSVTGSIKRVDIEGATPLIRLLVILITQVSKLYMTVVIYSKHR